MKASAADVVFSKYPIGKETPNGVGVAIDANGRKVVAYGMNLDDSPLPTLPAAEH
jgi:hypothetical protein